jgi:Ala-tRNA(Pro) deacylase
LLVDDDVINSEYVGCHPCINTSSLRIKSEDIFNKFVKATGHDFIVVHAE